jgi:hypothetical protein
MRIRVNLPKVEPEVYAEPEECPYGCGCTHFKLILSNEKRAT